MRRVTTALLLLAPAALAVVIASARAAPDPGGAEFQRLVGGLGLGAAVEPSRCAAAFDPRLAPACGWRYEPLPLGSCLCAAHAGTER